MDRFAKKLVLQLIKIYQASLSPDHGWFRHVHPHGYCRFYPSCSEYAYETIQKNGLIKGGWLAIRRLSRCHPYHPGGIDLVK